MIICLYGDPSAADGSSDRGIHVHPAVAVPHSEQHAEVFIEKGGRTVSAAGDRASAQGIVWDPAALLDPWAIESDDR